MVAGRKDRGKRQTAMQGRAGAGCGRNSTPRRNRIFFYYETRKPGIIGKISWFPGFLMELFWVAPWRLCVKSFLHDGRLQSLAVCMVADRKVWPAARTGAKGQRPTQGRAGAGLASLARLQRRPPAAGTSAAAHKWLKIFIYRASSAG